MKKQEFISELKAALAHTPDDVREEIIDDINEHFSEGASQGQSEEDICRNLGQPGSIAAQVLEEYARGTNPANEYEKIRGGYEISIDKSFAGGEVRNVDIGLAIGNIYFTPSTDGNFRVVLEGRYKHNKFVVENNGGLLVVKSIEPMMSFNLFRFNAKLEATVYVPGQFAGEIKARSAAGNVSSGGISGKLNFKTAAGNVSVDGHLSGEITLSTAAGNIALATKEARDLNLSTAAGKIKAEVKKLSGDTKLTSSAGNVKLTAYEVEGNIKLSTSAGNATAYLPANVNCRIKVTKPSIGSLHNELEGNPNSPYTLKATTSVGTIKLLAI